jgi:hypothetical protein
MVKPVNIKTIPTMRFVIKTRTPYSLVAGIIPQRARMTRGQRSFLFDSDLALGYNARI